MGYDCSYQYVSHLDPCIYPLPFLACVTPLEVLIPTRVSTYLQRDSRTPLYQLNPIYPTWESQLDHCLRSLQGQLGQGNLITQVWT